MRAASQGAPQMRPLAGQEQPCVANPSMPWAWGGSAMIIIPSEILGFFASALVLITFAMKDMRLLR